MGAPLLLAAGISGDIFVVMSKVQGKDLATLAAICSFLVAVGLWYVWPLALRRKKRRLPAILAGPIARDLGVATNWIFAAFSASLVISALLGPRVGRQVDKVGGRQVLAKSNLTFAVGLTILGSANSIAALVTAWFCLGVGMGLGLYDAAFGALGRIFGETARRPITGIALLAGFASTIGWPLTAWGLETIGWRNTCFAWAAAHIVIGLPLNWFVLPPSRLAE